MKKRKKKSRRPPKMKKRKRKTGRPSKMTPREQTSPSFGEELLPLDPEEFSRVFALAMKAAGEKASPTTPELPRVKLEEEDGSVSEYQFIDIPVNRAMMQVVAHYKDKAQGISALARVNEVIRIARSEDLAQWVRESPDKPESQIHPAVIEAAATIKLTKALRFPLPEFLREVHRIASEKYPEGDAW